MKLIDHQYLATPFYGSRRMTEWLRTQEYYINRKRVPSLMQIMGLKTVYRRPRTGTTAPGHRIYPYLLTGMEVTRPNQVWTADITYIPMAKQAAQSTWLAIGSKKHFETLGEKEAAR